MEFMHQLGFAFNFAWNTVHYATKKKYFLCYILKTSLLFLLFCLICQNISPILHKKLTLSSLCS